ncbi:arginyltransferase [Catenovulum maritimum]|uniref:Aspartate/glutamate leucyltransferase n=1 Tax=Catenovulum maritimum TaxID=1513271 RepID=A0A0J8H031_9ALTE|nr:arginyltransferase [Catenovulum maritimum]KMT66363.1 arginyl-tRNA-protein transferase [Catenovulum maritimum]
MSGNIPIKFGISQAFPCNYLPEQYERLLVAIDDIVYNPTNYEVMLNLGFRRSGEQVYRPHCESCQQCISIRIPAAEFSLSRNQKRTAKKCQNFTTRINKKAIPSQYFELYSKYINQRHSDSTMFPPDLAQFENFVSASWLEVGFLEVYDQNKLISISVIDCLPDSFSAVYTFFDPDYSHYSLGRFAILQMVEFAKITQRNYVYLGYQIDECQKMNYKTEYQPHEKLIAGHWLTTSKA